MEFHNGYRPIELIDQQPSQAHRRPPPPPPPAQTIHPVTVKPPPKPQMLPHFAPTPHSSSCSTALDGRGAGRHRRSEGRDWSYSVLGRQNCAGLRGVVACLLSNITYLTWYALDTYYMHRSISLSVSFRRMFASSQHSCVVGSVNAETPLRLERINRSNRRSALR